MLLRVSLLPGLELRSARRHPSQTLEARTDGLWRRKERWCWVQRGHLCAMWGVGKGARV